MIQNPVIPQNINPDEYFIYLFDLDKTLLSIDSDYEWGEFLCQVNAVNINHHRKKNEEFYQAYLAGNLNIYDHLNYQLEILTQHSIEKLNHWHEQFMEQVIIPHILPQGWNLLQDIKKLQKQYPQQVILSLVTATNDFVTAPIARYLGIDLVATQTEKQFDEYKNIIVYTGKPQGEPCFQVGKIKNTNDYLQSKGYPTLQEMKESNNKTNNKTYHTWFYSDSRNDIPLLEIVKNPVATNADGVLRLHAQQNNWQIVDWI